MTRLPFPPSAVAAFAAISLAFASCANPADGPATPSGPAIPIDKAKVRILCSVGPTRNEQNAPTRFSAECSLFNIDDMSAYAFPNAIVAVNGRRLTADASKTHFYNADVGSYSTGDELNLVVDDPSLGRIAARATVPASQTSFSMTPELPPKGTANSATEYALSWAAVAGASGYTASLYAYDSNNSYRNGVIYHVRGLSCTFKKDFLADNKTSIALPFLDFKFVSMNEDEIAGFAQYSSFIVEGATRKLKSNR